jgi:hypothetical protein
MSTTSPECTGATLAPGIAVAKASKSPSVTPAANAFAAAVAASSVSGRGGLTRRGDLPPPASEVAVDRSADKACMRAVAWSHGTASTKATATLGLDECSICIGRHRQGRRRGATRLLAAGAW